MKDIKKTEKLRIRKIFRISICVTLMLFVVISTIGVAAASEPLLYNIKNVEYIRLMYTEIDDEGHPIDQSETLSSPFDLQDEGSFYEFYFDTIVVDNSGSVSFVTTDQSVIEALVSLNESDVSSVEYSDNLVTFVSPYVNYFKIPSSLVTPYNSAGGDDSTGFLSGFFDSFSLVISWIVSFVGIVIGIFYANGSLTFLGFLAVAALAFSICLIIFSLIRNFLMFRG